MNNKITMGVFLGLVFMFISNTCFAQTDSTKTSPGYDPPQITKTHLYLLNRSLSKIEYALSKDKKKWKIKTLRQNKSDEISLIDSIFLSVKTKRKNDPIIRDTIQTLYPARQYEFILDKQKNMWIVKRFY